LPACPGPCWVCGRGWVDRLPWALLGLGVAPKENTGLSYAEVVVGQLLLC
jgi:hypothetical protein